MSPRSLSVDQVRAFSQAVLHLHQEPLSAEPLEHIIDTLDRLVPTTWFSVDEMYPGSSKVEHRGGRNLENIPDVQEGVREFAHTNPNAEYLLTQGFAPALRMSDFATFRQVQQTGFYAEVLSHLSGFRDQIGVVTRSQNSCLGFTLNRDRPFSEEERLLLELLQPHLEHILRRHAQYAALPGNAGLTAREREVLHWVCEGKRDSEIAVILQLGLRTVEQHVRAILRKLGTENRATAIAAIWRSRAAARSGPPTEA